MRLALNPDLPQPLRARLEALSLQVGSGRIAIPEGYDGPEMRVA